MTKNVKGFKMRTEYWNFEIKSGTDAKLEIEITFTGEPIPESELRKLFDAITLLLEATGRKDLNPSRG